MREKQKMMRKISENAGITAKNAKECAKNAKRDFFEKRADFAKARILRVFCGQKTCERKKNPYSETKSIAPKRPSAKKLRPNLCKTAKIIQRAKNKTQEVREQKAKNDKK